MNKFFRVLSFWVVVSAFFYTSDIRAAELRIVDSAGLVRGATLVKEQANVSISYRNSEAKGAPIRCTLKSLDGVADDQSATGTSRAGTEGECIFSGVLAGTWQASVDGVDRWKVRVSSKE